MPLRIITEDRLAPLDPLRDRTVAVVGFGSQGAAHALNLRDSGVPVIVANRRDSENGRAAVANGFDPVPIEDAVARADLVIVALPDEVHDTVWTKRIAAHLRPGTIAGFLHGFSIRYGRVRPAADIGVVMVAPKGPGRTLRDRFVRGQGIPCLFAVHQRPTPASLDTEAVGLAWANGIGCARAAIICTTFADETETDLFGEQAVLCGGMTELIVAAFETLVAAGYPPELAYVECCHEVKQVADLVYERGLAGMMRAISNTAEFGAHASGPRIVDETVRRRLESVLERVRDGAFAAELRDDHERGFPWLTACRETLRTHAIEQAGADVRAWMPWLAEASNEPPPPPHPYTSDRSSRPIE